METSKEIKNIAQAIVKAQSEFTTVKRTKQVKYERVQYAYAALEDIIDMARKPLAEAGIALLQFNVMQMERKSIAIVTKLIHGESGEWVSDSITLPLSQMTPQGVGAVITYGRRYSLSALLGIATEDDTDATNGKHEEPQPKEQPREQPDDDADTCRKIFVNIKNVLSADTFNDAERKAYLDRATKAGKERDVEAIRRILQSVTLQKTEREKTKIPTEEEMLETIKGSPFLTDDEKFGYIAAIQRSEDKLTVYAGFQEMQGARQEELDF